MDFHKSCRRAAAWLLTLVLTAALALPASVICFEKTGLQPGS